MKARLRICNDTDITRLFAAKLCGGVRGFEDCAALECFSNDFTPCIKTIMNFTFIVEPMNKRLEKLIQDGAVSGKHGEYIDCRSMITRDNVSGTITTTVDHNINFVAGDSDEVPPQEPQVLGWSRDADGKITNRHPVQVANTLTAQKGNTMQNYVVEREVLNASSDGCARTIGTHYADMNAESVTRKSSDGYGYVRTAVKEPSFRIRKLTNRECFRLMGVDDADIDKIQAADISKSQQYKLAGNSIVVDVLAAIFRKMFIDKNNESPQLSLF